jgi:hypothetical protein
MRLSDKARRGKEGKVGRVCVAEGMIMSNDSVGITTMTL